MFSRDKIIKTKNIIFDHTRFYDSKKLNFAHLLIVFMNIIIKMIKFSKVLSLITSESIVKKNADDIFKTEKNQKIKKFADVFEISKNAKNADLAKNLSINEQSFEKKPKIIQTFISKTISDCITDFDLIQNEQNFFEIISNALSN